MPDRKHFDHQAIIVHPLLFDGAIAARRRAVDCVICHLIHLPGGRRQ
eukprot:SAG11_NODE_3044_length_2734_cov_24.397723_5_plen_47_part_00